MRACVYLCYCENSHGTLWSRLCFVSFLFLYLSLKLKTHPIHLRDRPFNLKGGGIGFLLEKWSDAEFWEKNTLAGMGTEKNNLRQYFHNVK
jgi:hypothetical protein